jgi:hypothetical protein
VLIALLYPDDAAGAQGTPPIILPPDSKGKKWPSAHVPRRCTLTDGLEPRKRA